jgi:hypothetical protein
MSHRSERQPAGEDVTRKKRRVRRHGLWPDWTKEEDRVVDRFAVQMKTKCRFFQRLVDSAVAELEQFYQRHPECRPNGRSRTREAVRGRLHYRAHALGRGEVAARWEPVERRLSEKWTRKLQRGKGRPDWLCLRDCARMLLVELYEKGYDRSLRSCCIEIWKQRRKLLGRSWTRQIGA